MNIILRVIDRIVVFYHLSLFLGFKAMGAVWIDSNSLPLPDDNLRFFLGVEINEVNANPAADHVKMFHLLSCDSGLPDNNLFPFLG